MINSPFKVFLFILIPIGFGSVILFLTGATPFFYVPGYTQAYELVMRANPFNPYLFSYLYEVFGNFAKMFQGEWYDALVSILEILLLPVRLIFALVALPIECVWWFFNILMGVADIASNPVMPPTPEELLSGNPYVVSSI